MLDDAIHNILESKAEYPVLMRKPWNAKMTGLLSVNTMAEFVSLVKQIMKASTSKTEKITAPAVLALVGPSGSGKREITEALCGSRGTGASERTESGEIFVRPVNYCTEPGRYGHKYVPEEAFDRMMQGRTSFIVAHWLSTIRSADRILVIRNGRITESGTHRELLKLKGYYYDLYTTQFTETSTASLLK